MYYTVDRIEGEFAVLEDVGGSLRDVNLKDLPGEIKEGDILKFEYDIYIVDKERTEKVRRDLEIRLKKLFLN